MTVMNTLPYCSFPTTVVYIGNIDNAHKKKRYVDDPVVAFYKHCATPQNALDYLKRAGTPTIFFDRLVQQQHDTFDMDSINYLYEEIYNPHRYETVSCVVYHDKLLNIGGLEFFQKIEDSSAKKIWVTEEKDEKTIVTAFNQGLINFYVCNQDPQAAALLKEFIQQSQQNYFRASINTIIHPILEEWQKGNTTIPALLDPVFIEYLQTFIKGGNFTEYYLLDITGSFLFLDAEGKASALFIFNEQSFTDQCLEVDRFLQSKHSLSPRVVEKLKTRCQTVCFPFIYPQGFRNFDPDIEPVQILSGQQRYYIAYSKEIDYLDRPGIPFV
ncbi:hypothetical protein [Candidatus Odyssella acanthamoebae]|uniref:Uncharacterized protein n=1 Tax=Candidatus Odyssella acanthamoebae TaxID=91604 RepID=A0A077AV13_9PROT|nr:hypothetical protein [Candidatus Paracaedibacter acanthamoebae]AIK97002.1 hypothetical protein ID47_10070 [Candidatus Paracaedibacter acanthamoebae]